MKCNACWTNLEGRAIATTCGHIFCTDDASKILNSDSTCPMCEHMLSKSKMKAVDMAPSDEWINDAVVDDVYRSYKERLSVSVTLTTILMVMAGVPPQSIMKSAFKGVVFWIGQKDVEVKVTVNKAMQLRQKCEQIQTSYTEKMKQVEAAYTGKLQEIHGGYQKAMKKIQAMNHEQENLMKDKVELQEKYTEKSRQKRKLEEMYDALRKEYENVKRSGLGSMHNEHAMIQRPNPYAFAPTPGDFDEPRQPRRPVPGMAPITPATSADFWPTGQEAQPGPFDLPSVPQSMHGRRPAAGGLSRFSGGSPSMYQPCPPLFRTTGATGPSNAVRNLLHSPSRQLPQSRVRGL